MKKKPNTKPPSILGMKHVAIRYRRFGYNFSRLKSFGHRVLIFFPVQTNIRDQNLARNITGKRNEAP